MSLLNGLLGGTFGGQTIGQVFYGTTASTSNTVTVTTSTSAPNYQYLINQQQAQMAQYQNAAAQQAYGGFAGGGMGGAITGGGGISNASVGGRFRINAGDIISIDLPDGAVLHALADGSYSIEDKDAKITYKAARVREFNQFLNASDLLEEFVKYVKGFGVKQHEFMGLPIELFINWLVIRAAEADGEPAPDVPDPAQRLPLLLPAPTYGSRCLDCGRFIPEKPRLLGIVFCNGAHMDRYRAKRALIRA